MTWNSNQKIDTGDGKGPGTRTSTSAVQRTKGSSKMYIPHGVRWLERNRAKSGVAARIEVQQAFIDGALPLRGTADVLVVDPPRTGIVGFEALLPRTGALRLVLVSCDPATGARDLAKAAACGYVLERLVPIDAFPRTSHVEWVATLQRAP